MVNISSIYPVKDNYEFDFDYYLNKHMPMSIELLSRSEKFIKVTVERGVDMQNPEIKSSFVAMCHYYFETLEGFMEVFGPNAEKLQEDIKNYTNITPVIQINQVEISK
ncbi:EthD family reductase [Yeosuana marina]|uniref:EthD family reductase n=1 Tax=Yeosuana marina TaxID=1565536 RepID=UPI00141E72E8|nr:EthD family reductase [Yeosuana marina]